MYRIQNHTFEDGTVGFRVEKRHKFLWWEKWKLCKIEVFYCCGYVTYPAIFKSLEDAEEYIRHVGATVNALIPGHPFYQD